jgi:hypothetical protein
MEGLFSIFFEVLLCRASFGHYSGRNSTIEGIQGVENPHPGAEDLTKLLHGSSVELGFSGRIVPATNPLIIFASGDGLFLRRAGKCPFDCWSLSRMLYGERNAYLLGE